MRVKAVIAYDGSRFYGFQRQPDVPTVVNTLESALERLHIRSDVVGSGRTDRGVHATGQVVHFDVPAYWNDLHKLRTHLNRQLDAVFIRSVQAVSDHFHARYDAVTRSYRYIFATRELSVFERAYVARFDPFDPERLRKALRLFEGTYDFAAFHKSGSEPTTTVRTIVRTGYYTKGDYHILVFTGNAFLRSQVRLMTAAVMQAATGKISFEEIEAQLRNERATIRTPAPAQGLYLSRVTYPRHIS
jgi:tRNA pseudouridine38-40 synthase